MAVVGDPKSDRFLAGMKAPGPYRVEVQVKPRAPSGRLWSVLVHLPAEKEPRKSVKFDVPDDGHGPLELSSGYRAREELAEKVRPLAEEGIRQVRGLGLF